MSIGLDNKQKSEGDIVMEKIFHPVSGETGYFATEQEKTLIDAIIQDFSINQLVVTESSRSARGGVNE